MALTGNTNEEKIWNYLYAKLGNAYGVAGIMGNMYAESGLRPNNLQNSYEKKLGYTDSSYTSAVDKKVYTNFVYDKAGYGLVQWTYWSLKRDLLAYVQAKGASIGDLETQLEFLCKQLSESYASTVWNVCKTATSVIQASNAMLLKFERPADQSLAVQTKRASYGQTYYDKYAKSSTSSTTTIGGSQSNTGGITTMSVMIGHASIDENGRITGGAAGDQSGREVCKRTWYNKPWTRVFRPNGSEVAEKIARAMEQACANDHIGYDQNQRTTLFTQAKACGWDLSKITTNCETDCSALVAVCVNAAGINVSKDMYTGSEETLLSRTGRFTTLTSSTILNSSDYLKRGDILLSNGHTAVVLSNGPKASGVTNTAPTGNTKYVGKGIGSATAKATMNIRTGAGTQYKSLGTIKTGTVVEVLEKTASGWYKIVWPGADCGYAYTSNSNGKYYSYVAKITSTPTASTPSSTVTNYMVKVTADALNIRKGPGTSYAIAGCIRDKGTYTIIKENGRWGYLKSGAGWICLDYTIRR